MKKISRSEFGMVGSYYLDMFNKSLTQKEKEGAAIHLRMVGRLYLKQCELAWFPQLGEESNPYEEEKGK